MKKESTTLLQRSPINWRTSTKSKTRTFKLTIDVPLYAPLVESVINGIENDTLHVFHPDDQDALNTELDRNGAIRLNKRATLPVSIHEWLCLGCQTIERGASDDPRCWAFYECNVREVILPLVSENPPGPTAFMGKIVLTSRCFPKDTSQAQADACSFIIAHELVHVFDVMRFLVPAFMDWRQFWSKVLSEGSCCDIAAGMLERKRLFLDDYGSNREKAMMAEFWPSKADKWFRAFRKQGK